MEKLPGGLTVLMPVYTTNPNWLKTAVRSVLEQSFADFDFLIIDDGSDVTTKRILHEFACQDERIRLYTNPRNIGLTKTLNRGLRLCGTRWVARMDSDDICMPQRLETQAAYLKAHPETTVLGSVATYLENGRSFPFKHLPLSHEEITATLPFVCPFVHPTVVFSREAVLDVGGYPGINYAEDYALWLKLLLEYPTVYFHILPEALLRYRRGLDRPVYREKQMKSTIELQKRCWECFDLRSDAGGLNSLVSETRSSEDVRRALLLVRDLERHIADRFPEADILFLKRGGLRLKRQIFSSADKLTFQLMGYKFLLKLNYFLISSLIKIRHNL